MGSDIFDEGEFEYRVVRGTSECRSGTGGRVQPYSAERTWRVTPKQAYLLLNTDWPGPNSPVTVHDNFAAAEANEVRFVSNARMLLQTAREENGLPATNAREF